MKLLIAEDEHHVRERLAEGIDWPGAGIELTGAVASGKEALALLAKERVDIVLTDIQMPEMSGLELARQLKQDDPQIKVIILTGYDDFEYARESIEYGVFKFLVKPAENELVLEAVLEAKARRERELREKHDMSALAQRWKEQLPHLREQFYKNWLNGRYSQWELEKRSADLELSLDAGRYVPVIVDMDPISERDSRFQVQDRPLAQFMLYTIACDVLADTSCVVLQEDDGMTAIIYFEPLAAEEAPLFANINKQITGLLGTVKDCLKLTASAGIGSAVPDKLLLPQSFRQSRMALQERLVLGGEVAISYRAEEAVRDAWLRLESWEKEFQVAIETGDSPKLTRLVQDVVASGFSSDKPVSEARELLWRIVCLMGRIVHTHGWTLRDTFQEDCDDFEQFAGLLSREQIGSWLTRMSARLSRTIAERRRTGTQLAMSEIVRFIQERLHDESLSLHLVAERMFINYSYLSRTFKETTGEAFSDYVLRLRMERAKELLANGLKVYDAAERVGYRHVNYFSKSFQRFWGIKPSDVYKS